MIPPPIQVHLYDSKYIDIVHYLQAAASCGLKFFAAVIRYAGGGEQFLKHGSNILRTLNTDGVVHPLACFPSVDNSCIAEDLHVMGQRWLADVQHIQQLSGALFAVVEQLQNLDPVFIPQRFEYISHLSVCPFHGFTSIFLIRIVTDILIIVNMSAFKNAVIPSNSQFKKARLFSIFF